MEAVGPRFQNGDNLAAIGVSVGGIGVRRNYAHFPNRIGRGVIGDQVILRLVVFGAFDGVVVFLLAIAIDRCYTAIVGIALDGVVSRHAGGIGIDGAGLEKRERREVPAIQRDVLDLVRGEGISERRIAGIEDGMNVGLN